MSSLSTSLYGSTTNKGVGGLLSGLDTDDLVKQMTAATRNKINRQYQSKQKLLYRQEAYREISSKLLTFSDKYFSYASGSKTNILSPKFFESNTFKSSSNYVNVTGNAENIKNFEINSITNVASVANFSSSKKVSSSIVKSDAITDNVSSLAGETLSIEYDGSVYNLTIDRDFGKANNPDKVDLQDVADELNEQLKKITDKNGEKINESNELLKYEFVSGENKLKIVTGDSKKNAILTAASTDIINNLNFKTGQVASSTETISAEKIANLTLSKDSILYNDDSYFTFEYNGVVKKINLDKDFTTSAEIETHLKTEFDKAFGKDKVNVSFNGTELSLSAAGDNNIFGISSISKDLSNLIGLESGDYNRLNLRKPIGESGLIGLSEKVPIKDGKQGYKIQINNATIEIDEKMSVTDVINTINSNAEAGVRVYYSSTTNTFSVKATETGIHKGVSITDVSGGGNLAASLFGTSGTAGVDFTDIESLLNNKLKENEYYEYDESTDSYKIFDKTNPENVVQIGTAKLGSDNKVTTTGFVDTSRNEVVQLVDYIVKPGTDTEMTYTLNGVPSTITRSTANFTIDEINIELNEKAKGLTATDTPISFDVTNNSDEVVEKVKQFINDYNEIINLIGTKTSEKPNREYLPLSPEQQEEMEEEEIKNWNLEAKKGVLYGDRNMNSVLRSMRESMSGITDVSPITLSSIGISSASMDTSGKLVLDEAKFKEKLLANPDEIANLFTLTSSKTDDDAKSGIAIQLQTIIRKNVGAYGTTGVLIDEAGMSNSMTSDRNFISEKIKEYDDKMADLKDDLETERTRYWNQFSALESSLNKLNSQSSWLTDMMGQ